MVQFRPKAREVIAKIVYYGPPLGGKTTNLRSLFDGYPETTRGELVIVPAGTDRTIFFDFLPLEIGNLRGMKVRVQLYTVPGQVRYNATRQVVLRGVDGIVFVADSQREMLRNNQESWENLKENLILQGTTLAAVPHVLQYNKRDLTDIAGVDELDEQLNEYNAPFFEAVASVGIGVEETVQGVIKLVVRSLRTRFQPEPRTGVQVPTGSAEVDRMLSALRGPAGEAASDSAEPYEQAQPFPAAQPGPVPFLRSEDTDPGVFRNAGALEASEPLGAHEEPGTGEERRTVQPDVPGAEPASAEPPPFAGDQGDAFTFEPDAAPAAPGAVAEAQADDGLLGEFSAAEEAPPADGVSGDDAFAFAVADSHDRWWLGSVGEGGAAAEGPAPIADDGTGETPGVEPAAAGFPDAGDAREGEPPVAPAGGAFEQEWTVPAEEPDAGGDVEGTGQQEVWTVPEAGWDGGAPAFDVTEGAVTQPFRLDAVPRGADPDPFDFGEDPFEVDAPPAGDGSDDVFAIVAAPPPPVVVREPEPLTVEVPVEIADVRRVASRALAQYGEVRELELEVPVPSLWVGGKRMTLQLRLTLVPQEEGHDG